MATAERIARGLGVSLAELFSFDTAVAEVTRADRLGQRVTALARAASLETVTRFERVAEILLAPEGGREHRPLRVMVANSGKGKKKAKK